MTKLTPEQQVEILWKALADPDHWVAVNSVGQCVVHKSTSIEIPRTDGAVILAGSRDSIIEELLAMQVAARLEETKEPASAFHTYESWLPADRKNR